MPIYKSFLIFSSLIASIYYLRTYNSIPSQPKSNIDSPRLLGALKNKFCSDSEYDQPTSSDINKAIEFRSSFFENMRSNENLLKKAVRTSDWDEYVQSLISPTLVWIIFSAFSFIGWVFYCICCWFDKKCPPCPRLRRDTDIYPYEGFELWGLIFFIVILGTGIVAISIAGIIYSTKIEAGAQKVVCSLATIYDNIIYGSTFNETNWIGISNTPNMINSTLIELTNYPDKFFNSFNDTTWINTGIQNLLMANRNIYTKFKFSALSSPNPSYSSDVVSSNFIKNLLGPYTETPTMTGSIESQFQNTSVLLSSSLKEVYMALKNIATKSAEITLTINNSINDMNAITDSILAYQRQVEVNVETPQDYLSQTNSFFFAAWSINIFAAILGIFGGISVYLFKLTRMRVLLHVSWCTISILMLAGFILASILVPLGILTMEGCDIYNDIISSKNEFATYTEVIPSDVNFKLQTCLFGTGDLLVEYGIKNQVDELDNITRSFHKLSKLSEKNSNFSLSSSNILISAWQEEVDSLKNGLISDYIDSDNNNSFFSIDIFNKWSDYGVSGSFQSLSCSETMDNWVFNFSNCTYETKWISGSNPSYLYGDSVCIPMEDFDSSSFNTRYSSIYSICGSNISDNNKNYFNSLKNYDTSRRILFNNIGIDLTNLVASSDNYNEKLLNFNDTIYNFLGNIENFVSNISDPKSGLISSFNCGFLRSSVRDSYNSMCVSLFVPIYYQIVLICTTSLLMFFMSFVTYLAGMRFGKVNKSDEIDKEWVKRSD